MATIFAIDDDAGVLRLVELCLRIEGFEVQSFRSPLDALTALAEGQLPDALVLDVNMPDMDGREFYRTARRTGYENPVLIVSAFSPGSVCRELGADDWLAQAVRARRADE